jgi:CheY-like chemotaxis protein
MLSILEKIRFMSQTTVQSLNILIADDETTVADTIAQILGRFGHHVDVACDGIEANAKLEAAPGHYHVLITDSFMPGMSGIELVRKLRATADPCKIIFLSGDVDDEIEEECHAMRVEKIMLKPVSIAAIRSEIQALCAGMGTAAQN